MKKYDKEMWKDRQHDEYLQDKYGENWKVIKRSIEQYVPKDTGQPHSFAHLLNVKHEVQPLGNPQIRTIELA